MKQRILDAAFYMSIGAAVSVMTGLFLNSLQFIIAGLIGFLSAILLVLVTPSEA